MVGFDATTQKFIGSTPLESGPGTVRHVYFHQPTNAIYFGADANTVGRATLPPVRVLVP
jgi:virginiamycin B lyase